MRRAARNNLTQLGACADRSGHDRERDAIHGLFGTVWGIMRTRSSA
mgnify:CR=1 FL=1